MEAFDTSSGLHQQASTQARIAWKHTLFYVLQTPYYLGTMHTAHLLLGSWEILEIVELNSRKGSHIHHLPQPSVGFRGRHFARTFHSRLSSFGFIPHSILIIMKFIDQPSIFILCSSSSSLFCAKFVFAALSATQKRLQALSSLFSILYVVGKSFEAM